MQPLDVILLAGGHLDDHFAGVVGTKAKPLIRFEGVTVLYRMIHAFKESGRAGKIVLVGSPEVVNSREAELCDLVAVDRGSSPANIIAGLNALREDGGEPERVMICTTDLPFITPASIQVFFDQCGDADFYAPLIAEEAFGDAYPTAPVTAVKLRDGSYTTGCLYNATSGALRRCLPYIEQVFTHRKSKLKMANILGVGFTFKYLTRQLTVASVEQKISELLHCTARAIPESSPELAFDIDYIEDYHYVLQNYKNALAGKWAPPSSKETVNA